MTEWEREEFARKAANAAAAAVTRNVSVRGAIDPLFCQAMREHPDEEDRLLELWDRLASRSVV